MTYLAPAIAEAYARGVRDALLAAHVAREEVIHSGEVRFIDGIRKGHDRAENAILAMIPGDQT